LCTFKLFPASITSAVSGFSPDQERKLPGNPKIPEVVFLARKKFTSVTTQDSQLVTGSHNRSLTAIGSRFTHWFSIEAKKRRAEGRPTCHGQNLRSTPGQSEPIAQYFFKKFNHSECTVHSPSPIYGSFYSMTVNTSLHLEDGYIDTERDAHGHIVKQS
jgi:hypothetical protein